MLSYLLHNVSHWGSEATGGNKRRQHTRVVSCESRNAGFNMHQQLLVIRKPVWSFPSYTMQEKPRLQWSETQYKQPNMQTSEYTYVRISFITLLFKLLCNNAISSRSVYAHNNGRMKHWWEATFLPITRIFRCSIY